MLGPWNPAKKLARWHLLAPAHISSSREVGDEDGQISVSSLASQPSLLGEILGHERSCVKQKVEGT